ncbi:MFS transporter [Cupriavidus necator]|uniref:MFS transporter n=1 Tax=Cupriavidus necator TaxID=106590 RepID=UPI00339D46E6
MTSLNTVPGYKALVAARCTSSVALWLDFTLIFSLLAYHWHADAITIGVSSALYGLPGLVLGPFLGGLADRRNPVVMLAFSYLARGVTSMLLMVAPDLHVFVLLVLIKGIANLGAMPAEQILIRSMLNKEQLVSNASVMTAVDQLTKICAPLAAAGVTVLYRPAAGLWLSAALAMVGIFCLPALRWAAPSRTRRAVSTRPKWHSGPLLQLARENRRFRQAFACMLWLSAILGVYDPQLSLFLKEEGMPPAAFGMIVSCTAGGALTGALTFRTLHRRYGRHLPSAGLVAFGLTVLLPGGLAAGGVAIMLPLWLALWMANGCAYGLTAMSFGVTLQQEGPAEAIGSISAAARSAQLGALVVGPLLGASMQRLLGIPLVFVISGSLAVMGGAVMLWRALGEKDLVAGQARSAE